MIKIYTQISAGELLDKISILEIKLKKIKNRQLLKKIKKEHTILNKTRLSKINVTAKIKKLYAKLKKANQVLWLLEDQIRDLEKKSSFKKDFIKTARNIYFTNDQRSKIKLDINMLLNSNIVEVKGYNNSNIVEVKGYNKY